MKYVFDDGGRQAAGYRGFTGDCVTRSIAIAMGLPYQEVYDEMAAIHQSIVAAKSGYLVSGPRTARNGIDTRSARFRAWMYKRGWAWHPTMQVGSGCKVHLQADELPAGRLIVSLSKHYTAVIDGVIHDTYDPNDRGATIYPIGFPQEKLPKSARPLSNGNGWCYEPKRCVYGYWTR